MQAIVFDRPGDESVLRLAEVPAPALAPGCLRIRVAASGVNRADLMQRQGLYPPPPGASDGSALAAAQARVRDDEAAAQRSGARGTPTFFINGRRYSGTWDESSLTDAMLAPLGHRIQAAAFQFVRCIAVARILLPRSHVRLSAGRTEFSDELQALCFFAGANSIFYGEKLLTTGNPDCAADQALFARLGLHAEPQPS